MNVVIFCHSLRSDWNHGNAHFLRGICRDMLVRGWKVKVYEPHDGWSAQNLEAEHGSAALEGYRAAYPELDSIKFDLRTLDVKETLEGADVVLVHEWNDPELIRALGEHRKNNPDFLLFFHDTHHRAVSAPQEMSRYDLSGYDGVLAFGKVLRDIYLDRGWARNCWVWHEAADHDNFQPLPSSQSQGDLVWIGNWGDDERTEELEEFLLGPVRRLGLKAKVYGVRYPEKALGKLQQAGIEYGGWLPNYRVPEIFAQYRMTVHVPRRPYVECLPGIPTIRVFEALACGIPLICSPWRDAEHLFRPGLDFLTAEDGAEMERRIRLVLSDPPYARDIAENGRKTVLARHTCSHRVTELEKIVGEVSLTIADRRVAV